LDKDVDMNLKLFSELFPDAKVTPAPKKREDSKTMTPAGSGWDGAGLMVRYDPRSEASKQFELQEEPSTRQKDDDEGGEDDDEGGCNDDTPRRPETQSDASREGRHIYEESKLEAVFRKAREQPVSATETTSAGGGFAFSFKLDDNQGVPAPASSFSFAFNVGDAKPTVDDFEPDNEQMAGIITENPSKVSARKRRRGFLFEEHELDRYVENFYGLHDGDRIANDLESWRKDESVRSAWNQERKTLTLDWKRKRKAAVKARQHKRFRNR
jgi:hypothetical protein